MVLKIPRPFCARNGSHYFRVRVPQDVQAAFQGRTHFKKSLATKDPQLAKLRHAEEWRAFCEKVANLRIGPKQLTEREASKLSSIVYYRWLEKYRDNPSSQSTWQTSAFSELGKRLEYPPADVAFVCAPGQPAKASFAVPEMVEFVMRPARAMERIAKADTQQLINDLGLNLDGEGCRKLERAVEFAIQRACLLLEAQTRGEIVDLPHSTAFPPSHNPSKAPLEPIKFVDVFQGWKGEVNPREKTVYEWQRSVTKLEEFVGFNDIQLLTRDHVIQWKNSLVEQELAAKTINDGYLTAVRTVLNWAVDNTCLKSNPAHGVRVRQQKKHINIRGFSDEESVLILKAAASSSNIVKKWVPLLQCYSGARLSEVCQLRREDIKKQDENFATMSFVLEAGNLKTATSQRTIPLHPAIIAAGFMNFVEEAEPGPLFSNLKPNSFGSRGGSATKVLGPWVRSLGIRDKQISPTHSWRHRFKTLCRRYEIPEQFSDAITGHAPISGGRKYGDRQLLDILFKEVAKLPTITW